MTAEMFADPEGNELVAAIHERKTEQALLRGLVAAAEAFEFMAPLPPLKAHPRERLWEPAAVGFRDLPGGDAE